MILSLVSPMGKETFFKTYLFVIQHNFIDQNRDGKRPFADSWSKSYRITSDFRDRENKTFAPCFTYDNPNEYMMGKNNATVTLRTLSDTNIVVHVILTV